MLIIVCLLFIYCTHYVVLFIIIFVHLYYLFSIFKPTIWPVDVAAAAAASQIREG